MSQKVARTYGSHFGNPDRGEARVDYRSFLNPETRAELEAFEDRKRLEAFAKAADTPVEEPMNKPETEPARQREAAP